MRKLSKYEKETIINWNEGENIASIYTFNASLKRRLEDFSRKYAQLQEIISLWHKIPGEARGSAYVMIKGMLIAAQQLPQK